MRQQIPWLRLGAEGAVIVVSVLLALAGDAWRQERQDRAEELEILEALRAEFESNHAFLEAASDVVRVARDQLVALAHASVTATTLPDSSFRAVLSPIHRSHTIQLAQGFLESSRDSGKLALIRDPSLRAALTETQAVAEDLYTLQSWIADLSQQGALMMARYSEVVGLYADNTSGGEMDQRVPAALIQALLNDRDVMAVVGAKINYWNGLLGSTLRLGEHLAHVVSLIDEALVEGPMQASSR